MDIKKASEAVNRIIKDYKPGIIHSHNAPDTLTLTAIDIDTEVPVIHDVHEILTIHNSGFFAGDNEEKLTRYREEERRVCEKSDGLIHATGGIRRYVQQQYDVNADREIVFYNYVLESLMTHRFVRKLSERDGGIHIAYIGCITSVVPGSHYDLRGIFNEIADLGIHIHIYPTKDLITKSNNDYRRLAESSRFLHFHGTLDYRRLLYEITQYDFGWAGFNGETNREHVNITLPNKVFDYVSSGLPIISFPHKTVQRFIEKHGLGLVVEGVDELPRRLKDVNLSKLKERVMKSRCAFTMESNILKLIEFYGRMTGGREKLG